MVFGNKGESSGTGVCFTRDPSTGESRLYGEFLQNAQGEDVVAGIRTPEPIAAMEQQLPEAFAQLVETIRRLEAHYRDMQDIEFTVEDGHAVPPADAHREAHGRGGTADRDGARGRGRDLTRGGGGAHRARASSTSCCTR